MDLPARVSAFHSFYYPRIYTIVSYRDFHSFKELDPQLAQKNIRGTPHGDGETQGDGKEGTLASQ